MSLRAMPNLDVYRPADAVETAECWALALRRATGRRVLALTRQNLPPVRTEAAARTSARAAPIACGRRGAAQGRPDRDRLRGRDRARRRRRARSAGDRRRRRLDALLGAVRRAGRGLSRRHPARRRPARLDRGRHDARLGTLHRAARPPHRPRPLRRLGAGRRTCSSISASPPKRSRRTSSQHIKARRQWHDQSCDQRLRAHRPPRRPRHPRAAATAASSWSRSTISPTPSPTPCCSSATASTAPVPARSAPTATI